MERHKRAEEWVRESEHHTFASEWDLAKSKLPNTRLSKTERGDVTTRNGTVSRILKRKEKRKNRKNSEKKRKEKNEPKRD